MRGLDRRSRRLALGGLAALGALGLGAAAWLGWARAEAPPPVAAPPPEASAERPEPPPLLAQLEADEEPGRKEIAEAWRKMPTPGSLEKAAARDYRERARFPQWSHAIEDGVDPLRRDRRVTSGHSFPLDAEPVLWAEPARATFEAPAPVVLHARLEEGGERVPAERVGGEVRAGPEESVAELRFRDDGREGDATADDHVYTARLEPDEVDSEDVFSGNYMVKVEAVTAGGEERTAGTGFLYSVPRSQLTGRFRDSRAGGSLVVEAEVEVFEPSRFHLEATLGARGGEPLAWAQSAASLEPGRHWMQLTFYGLALSQSETDGPYRLLSVGLSTTGRMPNHPNELLRNAYVTRAYEASDFTGEPFRDPDLMKAARQLEGGSGVDPSDLNVGPP